ncbi:hypothetical protein QBC46DRAFT_461968 [Diplogelasinospora grovesii]|uniref:Uncharacterized protein n=1 Tax=Diplogelasinospora grovesii TaxID=303347 RepID=A0AAN6MZV8_9PEZI|nr:hypothetical protein QBC46DRAFT_461968 [Diplogelasinospora grovesii]
MTPNFYLRDSGLALLGGPKLLGAVAIVLFISALLVRRLLVRGRKPTLTQVSPHVLQFPPSRRHALTRLPGFEKSAEQVEIPTEILRLRALPTTKQADLGEDNQYTPTGFSTQDIRALGRFPDYAVLSGVRYPAPCSPNWDISRALFRPFRPFRWGYHQHMALMKLDPDWWVELEQNYHQTMAARMELLKTHGDRIFFTGSDGAAATDLACRELMEMLLQFVCKRYPQHFELSADKNVFTNRLLGTQADLADPKLHPLRALFENLPEDYALMLRNEADGLYYLRAAMVCSSVGWDIAQHRDEPLRQIHTHVPDYADKMAPSMDRYFSKMPTDAPIQRCSWSLEDWQAMFTSPEVEKNKGGEWTRSAFASDPAALTPKDLKLRCDWQTLRRLPLSGAIVFNFKAVFTPLAQLRDEPFIPALLLKVLQEGKENLINYKCVDHVRKVAMEALEVWAKEQVQSGIVPENWEVGTLEDSPFFPGWEDKWHRLQGF